MRRKTRHTEIAVRAVVWVFLFTLTCIHAVYTIGVMATRDCHVRIDTVTWQAARQRAAREGTTISAIIREFVTAYAAGQLTREWRP